MVLPDHIQRYNALQRQRSVCVSCKTTLLISTFFKITHHCVMPKHAGAVTNIISTSIALYLENYKTLTFLLHDNGLRCI
jgi:hypothetical protein